MIFCKTTATGSFIKPTLLLGDTHMHIAIAQNIKFVVSSSSKRLRRAHIRKGHSFPAGGHSFPAGGHLIPSGGYLLLVPIGETCSLLQYPSVCHFVLGQSIDSQLKVTIHTLSKTIHGLSKSIF